MTRNATTAINGMTSERYIVDYSPGGPGPCLVVFAGLHGDEVGGIEALARVRRWIESKTPRMSGRLVGLAGNLPALAAGRRFIDRDLNRNWYEEDVDALLAQDPADDCVEDREARELITILEGFDDEPNRPVVFLDLHSTSADGPPFVCMPDTLTNLRIALELPFPSILGLEESINGPLCGMLSDRGYRSVIVEGGRHDRPGTADLLESTVWVISVAMGLFEQDGVPDYGLHWNRLAEVGEGLPRVLEIRYKQRTEDGDGFEMQPGFEHYRHVVRGELLAHDNRGEIRAPRTGRILMPAYKPGTDQGFFIARDIPPLFVWILFLLRKMKLGRYCHLLPGARTVLSSPNLLEVASWVPDGMVNVIRLLGWRRTYRDSDHTILRRRMVRR